MSQTSRYHVQQNFKGLKVNPILVLQSSVGPLIGRYCGIRVPPEIQSSTGILSLSFHTDMAVAKDGFSARYNITHKEVTESKFKIELYSEFYFSGKKNKTKNTIHFLLSSSFYFLVAFHCSNEFGLQSGKITDDQITASSTFYDERWLPRQARLHYSDNGWTPYEDSNREYIQVQLHFRTLLLWRRAGFRDSSGFCSN